MFVVFKAERVRECAAPGGRKGEDVRGAVEFGDPPPRPRSGTNRNVEDLRGVCGGFSEEEALADSRVEGPSAATEDFPF